MTGVIALTDHPAAVRLSLALVHFVWQGAALAFVAVVLLAVLRKASAGARYLGLLIVFAAMAACPVVTFAVTGDAPAPVATAAVESVPREEVAPPPPLVADTGPPPVSGRLELESRTPSMAAVPEPWVVRARKWVGARLAWIALLWLGGVAVLSLRLLTRWWAVGRVRGALESASADWQHRLTSLAQRLSMRRPVRLLTSGASRVPMVIGWLRPVIVMPVSALVGLTPDQLAAVLTHELAHIRRFDHFVNLAQTLVEILLFYHPAVWWVSSAIRTERENCCDDVAVGVSGDVVGYMRALAWIEQNRASLPEAAIASSGTSLVSRIRRLAGGVSLPAGGYSWVAAAMALGVVMVLPITAAVSGLAASSESGQHGLGAREQWQPQTESDPRLQQPVHFEILGRAAVPVLAMLSEQTGVSLTVAPEDLDTVGERKLTIIAQGCTLKSLMAQVPKALQECHWDIDPSGSEPVYLLHRNAGAELTMAQLAEEEWLRRAEAGRPGREARVGAARRALAMSPEELVEFEKTDLLLARSVRDAEARKRVELFFSLPAQQMHELLAYGQAPWGPGTAPERFQTAARDYLSFRLDKARREGSPLPELDMAGLFTNALSNADKAIIGYEGSESEGIRLEITVSCGELGILNTGAMAVPPARLSSEFLADEYEYRDLLLRTGTPNAEAANALLIQSAEEYEKEAREQRSRRRAAEWREPRSPELHRTVLLPFEDPLDLVEVQRFIAKETDLSLVSDYFTTRSWGRIPEEAKAALPVWQLLHLLGEGWFWTYEWDEAGNCLVFHDRNWYRLAPQEFPESMVLAYREKLKQQGGFTLDDVATAAVELERRRPVPPSLRRSWEPVNIPSDLREGGLSRLRSPALLLYASLSPEQREKARSGAGLPYTEMTVAQQELVRPYALFTGGPTGDRYGIAEEEIARAVYRVRQSSRELGSETREMFELRVEFPSLQQGATLMLLPPKPAAEPALAGQD